MNNTNLIYQRFRMGNGSLSFPYPPIYIEDNTDYICFCTSPDISSNFWKILQVDDFSSPNIQDILNSYINKKEILSNQLLTGSVFHKNDSGLPSFITIPSFYELTDLIYDERLFVPTKDSSGNYIYKKNPVYTDGKYDGRPLLLTIGVPVSNQIQTIERCLSHIKPILDQLDAELLVVDTGSTDGTIEVCKAYGARIITFPWCNNMSAARNQGIYHALGLWYLSIDDDEWFEDTEEIIQFFKGGLYKFYHSASYIQRNYHQSSGKAYSDHHTVRMARITPELHFEGRIHDALILPPLSRQYQISCYAHHYGFIHDDHKLALAKYQRNASLLLYDILEYPEDLRYNYQLANEFHVMGYFKEAFAYHLRGIAIGKERPNFYHEKSNAIRLFALLSEQKNELLFPFIALLKDSYSFTIPELVYIPYIQAQLSIQIDKTPDETLSYIQSYKEYYEQYTRLTTPDVIHTSISMDVCNNIECITNIHVIAFCAYCQKKDEFAALTELKLIQPEHMRFLIRTFCCHFIKAHESIYSETIKKLSVSDITHWSNHILYAFMQSFDETPIRTTCLLRFCDILPYFTIPLLDRYVSQQLEDDISPEAKNFLCNAALSLKLTEISLQELYFFSLILYKAIGRSTNRENNQTVFERYVILTGQFVQLYYYPELLKQIDTHLIPSEFLAAYYTDCALKEKGDVLTNFQIASAIHPEFKEYIEVYLYKLSTTTTHNPQFDELLLQLKQNVHTLLSLGHKNEAYQLLLEFQFICPNDNEIKELLKLASSK